MPNEDETTPPVQFIELNHPALTTVFVKSDDGEVKPYMSMDYFLSVYANHALDRLEVARQTGDVITEVGMTAICHMFTDVLRNVGMLRTEAEISLL